MGLKLHRVKWANIWYINRDILIKSYITLYIEPILPINDIHHKYSTLNRYKKVKTYHSIDLGTICQLLWFVAYDILNMQLTIPNICKHGTIRGEMCINNWWEWWAGKLEFRLWRREFLEINLRIKIRSYHHQNWIISNLWHY